MTKKVLILLLASTLFLSACGDGTDQSAEVEEPTSGSASSYIPVKGPSELTKHSDVVIRGSTGEAQEGRVFGTSRKDPAANFTMVFPVKIDSIEAGRLDPAVQDTVYMEMFVAGSPLRGKFAAGLSNRTGLFYLYRKPDKSPPGEIANAEAGRPAGQPMYGPTSPEGTFIETQNGGGVWSVGTSEEFEGLTLDDFGPEVVNFPASDQDETN